MSEPPPMPVIPTINPTANPEKTVGTSIIASAQAATHHAHNLLHALVNGARRCINGKFRIFRNLVGRGHSCKLSDLAALRLRVETLRIAPFAGGDIGGQVGLDKALGSDDVARRPSIGSVR